MDHFKGYNIDWQELIEEANRELEKEKRAELKKVKQAVLTIISYIKKQ